MSEACMYQSQYLDPYYSIAQKITEICGRKIEYAKQDIQEYVNQIQNTLLTVSQDIITDVSSILAAEALEKQHQTSASLDQRADELHQESMRLSQREDEIRNKENELNQREISLLQREEQLRNNQKSLEEMALLSISEKEKNNKIYKFDFDGELLEFSLEDLNRFPDSLFLMAIKNPDSFTLEDGSYFVGGNHVYAKNIHMYITTGDPCTDENTNLLDLLDVLVYLHLSIPYQLYIKVVGHHTRDPDYVPPSNTQIDSIKVLTKEEAKSAEVIPTESVSPTATEQPKTGKKKVVKKIVKKIVKKKVPKNKKSDASEDVPNQEETEQQESSPSDIVPSEVKEVTIESNTVSDDTPLQPPFTPSLTDHIPRTSGNVPNPTAPPPVIPIIPTVPEVSEEQEIDQSEIHQDTEEPKESEEQVPEEPTIQEQTQRVVSKPKESYNSDDLDLDLNNLSDLINTTLDEEINDMRITSGQLDPIKLPEEKPTEETSENQTTEPPVVVPFISLPVPQISPIVSQPDIVPSVPLIASLSPQELNPPTEEPSKELPKELTPKDEAVKLNPTWTCICGYQANTRKCPNCGARCNVPEYRGLFTK